MLHRLIAAMQSTQRTDLKYLIQKTTPILLDEMNRAHTLRGDL